MFFGPCRSLLLRLCCMLSHGGILAGDRVELDGSVDEGAALALLTQSSTKIYKPAGGNNSSAVQSIRFAVAPLALLVVLPQPVTCFEGSRYVQRQAFDVAAGGSLVPMYSALI
eukprot:Opistho-2@45887